jgi:2'-5' RNA ligase
MYYALVYFLKTAIDEINKIRRPYDPTYAAVEPHLTLLFPVSTSAGKEKIIRHIGDILQAWQPFKIRFGGFGKSWDHWLFLLLKDGLSETEQLYSELYTGFLSEYRRDDIEFVPHIGLGLFVQDPTQYDLKNPRALEFDEKRYRQALAEAEITIPEFECMVERLDLVEANEDFSRIVTIKEFLL